MWVFFFLDRLTLIKAKCEHLNKETLQQKAEVVSNYSADSTEEACRA